jgi:hypothetical protein
MSKIENIAALITKDWMSANELCKSFGWQSHTLRGALSLYGRKKKLKIERRRENGITSYHIEENEKSET